MSAFTNLSNNKIDDFVGEQIFFLIFLDLLL
jgi:hypothetical protein